MLVGKFGGTRWVRTIDLSLIRTVHYHCAIVPRKMVGLVRIELTTNRLKVYCATNCATVPKNLVGLLRFELRTTG